MKKCSKCNQEKELQCFPNHSVNGKKYINSWCRDCCRERSRIKYQENREHQLALKKKWQANNVEKQKEIRKKTAWKIKIATLEHYGGKCTCCSEDNPIFLCIDHINDDGYKTRKQNRRSGVTSFYYWIKKNNYPTDLQVLCYNCNMAKSLYKICPHKLTTNSL